MFFNDDILVILLPYKYKLFVIFVNDEISII